MGQAFFCHTSGSDSKYTQEVHRNEPRALRSAELRSARITELSDSRIAPLEALSLEIAMRESRTSGREVYIPHFDPGDAGTEARILVVLEAPGPMTHSGHRGSGFISVDNDDQTAENSWRLREESGALDGVLHWNIVPWYLGAASVKPTVDELQRGAEALSLLLEKLPKLEVVILAGRYAQRGWNRTLSSRTAGRYRVLETWHPSPLAMNASWRRSEALDTWKLASQ